jgi:hypothetical protein
MLFGPMIKFLFLYLILLSQHVFACSCDGQSPLINIARSDFVAKVNILNVSPDINDSNFSDVEIGILDLYKGDETSLLKNYSVSESMCGIETLKDTTWLIYANRNNNGYLNYDLCTGSKQLDKKFKSYKYPNAQDKYDKYMESKLELLEYLKDEDIQFNDELGLRPYFSKECLKDFNGIEVKTHRFSLYEITIDDELNILMVEPIKEFDNEDLHEDLLTCVNKSVKIYQKDDQIEISENTKITVGLFYTPGFDGDQSTIDIYDF